MLCCVTAAAARPTGRKSHSGNLEAQLRPCPRTMAHSSATSSPVPVASRGYLLAVPRAELLTGLVLVGFANGFTGQAINAIRDSGVTSAVLNTFGVSVIVWCAAGLAVSSFWRGSVQPINRADLAV